MDPWRAAELLQNNTSLHHGESLGYGERREPTNPVWSLAGPELILPKCRDRRGKGGHMDYRKPCRPPPLAWEQPRAVPWESVDNQAHISSLGGAGWLRILLPPFPFPFHPLVSRGLQTERAMLMLSWLFRLFPPGICMKHQGKGNHLHIYFHGIQVRNPGTSTCRCFSQSTDNNKCTTTIVRMPPKCLSLERSHTPKHWQTLVLILVSL